MPETRMDLREIAIAALFEMPQRQRVELLTEMLVLTGGDDALQLLAGVRNAVTLRIEQLVDDRYSGDGSSVIPACPDDFEARALTQCQSTGSKSWAGLHNQEAMRAYLSKAPAEELRAMANRFLEKKLLSQAEEVVREQIMLALTASEKLSRRWTRAIQDGLTNGWIWRRQVSASEGHTS